VWVREGEAEVTGAGHRRADSGERGMYLPLAAVLARSDPWT